MRKLIPVLMTFTLPAQVNAVAMSNEAESHANGTSVIPPKGEHKATMIFLHGFGESVDSNWMPILLPLSASVPGLKWTLPQAPLIPSSYNNGALYPAWFDTPSLNFLSPQDDILHQDLAVQYLLSLVQGEYERGVKKVFIGGYSQGATIALLTALTGEIKVDGLAIVKGWVARSDTMRQELKGGNLSTPIFWAAGKEDDVVTPAITKRSLELMIEFGNRVHLFADSSYVKDGVVFKYYGGEGEGHAVGPEELQDLIVWLQQAISPLCCPRSPPPPD